jgi:hypothetical protein
VGYTVAHPSDIARADSVRQTRLPPVLLWRLAPPCPFFTILRCPTLAPPPKSAPHRGGEAPGSIYQW